jgi:hypothetical protein
MLSFVCQDATPYSIVQSQALLSGGVVHAVPAPPSHRGSVLTPTALFADVTESGTPPFPASHFLEYCFGLIPAPGSFASSAFPVPPDFVM